MTLPDEHDDDLEPEVIEGAEIEQETFDEPEEVEEGSGSTTEQEPDDESSDTI